MRQENSKDDGKFTFCCPFIAEHVVDALTHPQYIPSRVACFHVRVPRRNSIFTCKWLSFEDIFWLRDGGTSLFPCISRCHPVQMHLGPVHVATTSVSSYMNLFYWYREPCFHSVYHPPDSYSICASSSRGIPDPRGGIC